MSSIALIPFLINYFYSQTLSPVKQTGSLTSHEKKKNNSFFVQKTLDNAIFVCYNIVVEKNNNIIRRYFYE
nr:MAG TPA: hypothetical protein [Caudoviricetes sp.]